VEHPISNISSIFRFLPSSTIELLYEIQWMATDKLVEKQTKQGFLRKMYEIK